MKALGVYDAPKGELTTLPKYDEMVTHQRKRSSNNTRPKNTVIRTARRILSRPELINTPYQTGTGSKVANTRPRAEGHQSKPSPCCQTPGKAPSNSRCSARSCATPPTGRGDPQWVRDIIADCRRRGVTPFHKQWGTHSNNPLVVEQCKSIAEAKALDKYGKGGGLVDGKVTRTARPLIVAAARPDQEAAHCVPHRGRRRNGLCNRFRRTSRPNTD
jgi:hypothetical protein